MSAEDKIEVGRILRKILSALVHIHEDGKAPESLLMEIGLLIEKFDN